MICWVGWAARLVCSAVKMSGNKFVITREWLLPVMAATIFIPAGCRTLEQSSKYGLNEGWYKSTIFTDSIKKVYVVPANEAITAFATTAANQQFIDSTQAPRLVFTLNEKPAASTGYSFRQHSFDVDVLTIPIKYRPRVGTLSNQVITSVLNGAVYIGRRTDIYHVQYKQTPFRTLKRNITHYGFSFGVFSGIGSTMIDPGVTDGYVNFTYEGFINPTGIAAIVGINRFGFGLLAGIDNFIDRNRRYWAYRGKPWLGLSLGLNLN